MWYFTHSNGSHYYFWKKSSYTIGRKDADILIRNDDSLSKKHAKLYVSKDEVLVEDKGSKYGTYINERKLEADQKVKLQENSIIRFGLVNSYYQLQKLKIKTALSNVKAQEKETLFQHLRFLQASCLSSWKESCTHLIVGEVILTVKVLSALTQEQHIVNLQYFADFEQNVRNNFPPPKPEEYLPVVQENLLNKNIKLVYNSERKRLFKDKVFVFLTEKCKNQLAELIRLTGGTAISWEKSPLEFNKLKSEKPEYLLIEENFQNVDENSQIYSTFSKAVSLLTKINKRSIPFPEIALAVVHCSCEEHCNPNFNRLALLVPETQPQLSKQVFVYETESVTNATQVSHVVIPDSCPSETQISISEKVETFKRPLEDKNEASCSKKRKDEKSSENPFELSKLTRTSTQTSKPEKLVLKETSKNPFSIQETKATEVQNTKPRISLENPFARKPRTGPSRELSKPLDNISNFGFKRKSPDDSTKSSLSSTSENLSKKQRISCITKCSIISVNDLKKLTIKEEDDDGDTTIKKEKDVEFSKWNESFKEKIIIETIEIVQRKRQQNTQQTNHNVKNFKKFRKVQPNNVQSEIISANDMECYIVGRNYDFSHIEDEEPEDDEFENTSSRTLSNFGKLKPTVTARKKYNF